MDGDAAAVVGKGERVYQQMASVGKEDGELPGHDTGCEEHAEEIRPGSTSAAYDVVSGNMTTGASD
jgi:hypothetical protein